MCSFSWPKRFLGFCFGKRAVVVKREEFTSFLPSASILSKGKKNAKPCCMPPLPLHPAWGWGSNSGARHEEKDPRTSVAELGTWMAQKGGDSLVFVAFLGQLQAGQLRPMPKSTNLFLGSKHIRPFYVRDL